jgi:hypothetical protein
LIERKKEKDDFDLVLTFMEDRFTRGGARHGMWAEWEFLRNNIHMIHLRSSIPEGPYADVVKSLIYEACRETAKGISLHSTRSLASQIENGFALPISHTPYGLYRLYADEQGTPQFIIRDLRDGTQQKLDVNTHEVLVTYGQAGEKATNRFRKQKRERAFLVAGYPEEVETIRMMMRWRYIDGWGGHRIADELGRLGVRAPRGGTWTQRQADVIVENPAYFGWSIFGHTTSGIFHSRLRGGPVARNLDPMVMATQENLRPKINDPTLWQDIKHPFLKDFLPEDVQQAGSSQLRALLERRALGQVASRKRIPHVDSLYILSGLITAMQDGRALAGQNCGPRTHVTRYYSHPVARKNPALAGFPNTTFRAEAIEGPLLQILGETLRAMPELKDELRLAVQAAANTQKPASGGDRAELVGS